MAGLPQLMIARPSVASLYLQPEFEGTTLGNATGFVVEREAKHYLVTNFHVVSGRHPDTLANVLPSGAWPKDIRIAHNAVAQLGVWTWKVEGLYDGDGQPLWLEHPVHGHRADVVALPLTDTGDIGAYPYDPWEPQRFGIQMAGALSIVGFPFGVAYGGSMAVWVRGFVASESDIDFGDLPRFLIDSRTRPGQSGSPVILYNVGGAVTDLQGNTILSGGTAEEFVGVYSGRINEESDLGFVWKASVLRETIEGGVRGTVPGP